MIDADALVHAARAIEGVAAVALHSGPAPQLVVSPEEGVLARYLEACAGDAELWVLPDGSIALGLNGHELAYMAWEQGTWDSYRLDALPDGPCTVVDAGANVGLFAVRAAMRKAEVRVLAVEPIPALAALVRANARLHGCDAQVTVRDEALGSAEATATFAFAPLLSALSSRFPEERRTITRRLLLAMRMLLPGLAERDGLDRAAVKAWLNEGTAEVPVEVRVQRLSTILEQEDVDRVDLLKVDVEGSELEVLRGIDDAQWPIIRRVAVEVNDADDRVAQVAKVLEQAGMAVEVEDDPSASHATPHRICMVHGTRGTEETTASPTALVQERTVLDEARRLATEIHSAVADCGADPSTELAFAAEQCVTEVRTEGRVRGRSAPDFVEPVSAHLASLLGVEPVHLGSGWRDRMLPMGPLG